MAAKLCKHEACGSQCASPGSSADEPADVRALREIPHALFCHIFPGLPVATIIKLSISSRQCWHAARVAIPRIRAALVASVSGGCKWMNRQQAETLIQLLNQFRNSGSSLLPDQSPSPSDTTRDRFFISAQGTKSYAAGPGDYPEIFVLFNSARTTPEDTGRAADPGYGPEGCRSHFSLVVRMGSDPSATAHFYYEWDHIERRVVRSMASIAVSACADIELGQALLLFFQAAWDWQSMYFRAPVRSLLECGLAISSAGSLEWFEGKAPIDRPETWECLRKGPRLLISSQRCLKCLYSCKRCG
eukprot:jgi/Botrbrau1/12829/Bobra.0045s0001.1